MTLILSNEEVEQLLDARVCIEALEDAYLEQADGRAISQLRTDAVKNAFFTPDLGSSQIAVLEAPCFHARKTNFSPE